MIPDLHSFSLLCTMEKTTLIFATNNHNKIEEIQQVVGDKFTIITLQQAGIDIDIPEPYDSFEENAFAKSSTIHKITGKNCFSEDTGLEVEALNGLPGVKSARYAGEEKNFAANNRLLLQNLEGVENREARFRTVISLIYNGKNYYFEGICKGRIAHQPAGSNGFGYDPVFIPDGSGKTFAEMDLFEKNRFSHRKKATAKLMEFLNNNLNG